MANIHEFYPVVYPFRLWVIKKPTNSDVKDNFWGITARYDTYEIDDEMLDRQHGNANAWVLPVAQKESKRFGALVCLENTREMTVGKIAHEASHVVDWVCEHVDLKGFSYAEGEARAYLTGWVADCINNVLKGKVKSNE
jgi:hypothetical protein